MRALTCLRSLWLLGGLKLGLATPISDSLSPAEVEVIGRQESPDTTTSCNRPHNRACWLPGFDVNTDYEEKTPDTGVTRRYNLVITEESRWVGGDGIVKEDAMLVNGQFPGPTIRASWGDWVEVTVTNKLKINGTSIHWHGIRFLNNNINDGANGVTECPLAPNKTKTYRFRAEQYGTTWYHSHFSNQYGNGVVGPIIFEGPASHNYDEDLGAYPITDWYWLGADALMWRQFPEPGEDPNSDNILFNGTHVNKEGGGSYNRVKLKAGKRHRLRLINTSVDNPFTVSLVGHNLTIIQTDFVPVRPYTTDSIYMNVGQRYDVIIDADKPIGNYWFNVTHDATGLCGETDMPYPAAIFQYEGASSTALPTDKGTPPPHHYCQDITDFKPMVRKDVPKTNFLITPNNTLVANVHTKEWRDGIQKVYWEVNGFDFNVTWDEPTLEYVAKGNMNFPNKYNTIIEPEANRWSFWVLENPTPMAHPMHLHGHDLYILGSNEPQKDPLSSPVLHFNPANDTAGLRFKAPLRRDVVTLPANGWVAVAFKTDNPGAWLFHCHIAWHASQGLAVQVIERIHEIPRSVPAGALEQTCREWTEYYSTAPVKQEDSGV